MTLKNRDDSIYDELERSINSEHEFTHEQLWRLILAECADGGFPIETALEYRKTRKYPKGEFDHVYFSDVVLLLSMLTDEMINDFMEK